MLAPGEAVRKRKSAMSRKVSMPVLWGCAWLRRRVSVARGPWLGATDGGRELFRNIGPKIMAFVVLADAFSLVSLQYGSVKFCGVHLLGSIGRRHD